MKGSRDLLLECWDPLHISTTVEARNFKFGTQTGHWGSYRKYAKLGQKRPWRGHVTYFMQFWDALQADWSLGVLTKNAKLGQHGREQGHVTFFFKFWNLSKTVSQTISKQKNIAHLIHEAMQSRCEKTIRTVRTVVNSYLSTWEPA